jgi:parvulin-like peptidyl-prolyl isomerase
MIKQKRILHRFFLSALTACTVLGSCFFGHAEAVDGIVAVINNEIITLVDVKIIQAFRLYEIKAAADTNLSPGLILDRLIDQKLVIQLTSEDVPVSQAEINDYSREIEGRLGGERWELIRKQFGLNDQDLYEYIYELLLYQKIISQKFRRSVFVNLKEIQTYYNQVYSQQLSTEGIEPKPMVDVLDQIENAIKQEKVQKQVEEWLRNLRQKADIQLFVDLYPDYFIGDSAAQ